MAQTNYYVDPDGGNDANPSGTLGLPWKTIQHAIDEIVVIGKNTADGDCINIKNTTECILGSSINTTDYTPAKEATLGFRGYSSVADDGGIGIINGSGQTLLLGTPSGVWFKDMHLYSGGSENVVNVANYCSFINCEIDNSTLGAISGNSFNNILNCYIHNIGTRPITLNQYNSIMNCYLKDENNTWTYGIYYPASIGTIERNIISLNSNCTVAIYGGTSNMHIINNSIYSTGINSGKGIYLRYGRLNCSNNLVQGFAVGIEYDGTSEYASMIDYNTTSNCTTDYDLDSPIVSSGNNEIVDDNLFTFYGEDTFENRFNYFSPRNIGNVIGGGFPMGSKYDRGAVPFKPCISIGMNGGING